MIDFHQFMVNTLAPVKMRPADCYLPESLYSTNADRIEIADTQGVFTEAGKGTGVIENTDRSRIHLFHLGNAMTSGPRKINNLPSACDLILHTDTEIMAAELTESNQRSIEGVAGSRNPGKLEKARRQLRATVGFIENTGYISLPQKRTAIFFFRLSESFPGVAARSVNAFGMRPTMRTVTTYLEPDFQDWEFRNHPYPIPYRIS